MKKIFVLPVILTLFAGCSSPVLEWIETGTGISLYKASDKAITSFSFGHDISDETDTIRTSPSGANGRTPITVIFSAGSGIDKSNLAPAIEYIGKSISPESGVAQDFRSPVTYRITAENGSWREYEVNVIVKEPGSAELKWFDLELPGRSYMAEGAVTQPPSPGLPGSVALHVPSGTNLSSLTAEIVQTGKKLTAPDGAEYSGTTITLTGNFSGPKVYKVTAEDGTTKNYTVTVNVDPSGDAGIFKFDIFDDAGFTTPIPNSFVILGTASQPDGKIPITIQVPYGTNETDMYARIGLSDPFNAIVAPGDGLINFDPQEAVYTVTAQNGNEKTYVVRVSQRPEYYYVAANGRDTWPDIYNGSSESQPFKTLAYAVQKAAKDGIKKILIIGDLGAADQAGADAAGDLIESDSVVTIDGAKSPSVDITIASVNGSTIRGTSGKRALTVKGGVKLKFENVNVTGGNTAGNGGGVYVGGNSHVNFSGNITGNTAASGGGVYVEAGEGANDYSTFTLTSGSTISGNTATGGVSGDPDVSFMSGGGGVYIKGNANFYLGSGGTISGNTARGAGGGVLVNGNVKGGTEYGFVMPGGKITGNTSTSWTYPHGGGGVYVAHGAFEMQGGEITGNSANRQGGGVFVHWGDARFTAYGNSTITGNTGTGSSKAICNRGVTALTGSATADYVYIWDHGDSQSQSFILTNNTRITTGIALAYSAGNKNFITLASDYTGAGAGTIKIDLESHLNSSGNFVGQLEPDWLGKTIIVGNNSTLNMMLSRLELNTFTGQPSVYNLAANYKIAVSNTVGTFAKK